MKLEDLKKEIQKYQYLEDTKIIDVSLASIIATRLSIGAPVWLTIIGASSGGKSQILRPLALTDKKFLHRIDDITENTFLSGSKGQGGADNSLLNNHIKDRGIIVISDLTVLMSKSSETRNAILSQFRMLYDGEMIKHVGNKAEPLQWKGHLGVLSGSTPSIYRSFEEVADMGERFIYFRMKDFDDRKATRLALTRKETGHELDDRLSSLYGEYLESVVLSSIDEFGKCKYKDLQMTDDQLDRLIDISSFAEKVRTPVTMDKYTGEVLNIPVSAFPMRVSLQLDTIAKALMIMQMVETGSSELSEEQMSVLDWCAYSLANEEKRACLKVLASVDYDDDMSTQLISDEIGLSTGVTRKIMQNLASTGVCDRYGSDNNLRWSFKHKHYYETVRRIEDLQEVIKLEDRAITTEELENLPDEETEIADGVYF